MSVRPYQTLAKQQIKEHYVAGRRKVLLKLATGGGKTHIFSDILTETAARGNPCIMVVRGRQLVDQASKRLFHEGVNHGVLMARHWNTNHSALVQICSIDTLLARSYFPPARLVVVDEAHLFTSDGCKEFLEHYRNAFVLAVTATPYTRESLEHLADAVVAPISVSQLISDGFLVPPRYFAPSTPDMRGLHTRNGDYLPEELEERMSVLTGDIVQHWKTLGESRPTICFAVNIRHSKSIVEQFNAAGIPAEHIEGDNTFKEREDAIERLKSGQIKILSNVGVLCTGVDIPFVSAILMARPTKSYNLFIQQAGRGTRICPDVGKKDFLILDHAGNVLRHGLITDEPEIELAGVQVEYRGPRMYTCEKCYVIYTGSVCHACGFVKIEEPELETEPETEDGVLAELEGLPLADEISLFVRRKRELAKRRGYHHNWVYHQTVEKYGDEIAEKVFPTRSRQRSGTPWFLRRARESS